MAIAQVAQVVLLDKPHFYPLRRRIAELVAEVKVDGMIEDDEEEEIGG